MSEYIQYLELQTEIDKLKKQKLLLQHEIDGLEKFLQEYSVKGDITLQCGTQTRIEPQFHLKLDPNFLISQARIVAIIEILQRNTHHIDHRLCPDYVVLPNLYLREGRARVIELWSRTNSLALD